MAKQAYEDLREVESHADGKIQASEHFIIHNTKETVPQNFNFI